MRRRGLPSGRSDAVSSERRSPRGNGQCARERPKLAPRRQARVSRGRVAARRSGATRVPRFRLVRMEWIGGVVAALALGRSCALGSRAMARVLVSNVGCRSWREASSTSRRGLPRGGQRRGGGSAARRRVRTGRVDRGGRKGAEGSSAWTFTGKHESAHSIARSRVEPAEGAPVSFVAASLTGGSHQGAWQRGWSSSLTKDGHGARTRRRNLRASVHEATGSVRGGGVGFGPPSRRAQGVCSQRRRHVRGTPWSVLVRHARRAALDDPRPKPSRRKTVASSDGNASAN